MSEAVSVFDFDAFVSPLSKYSSGPVSYRNRRGHHAPCANEIELCGVGFACVAVARRLLGFKYYEQCSMKDGRCPLNLYKASYLPVP